MSRVRPVIVVIEDDSKLLRLLRGALQHAGYEVRHAASGRAGLSIAASGKPDLIIVDLGLPDMDGAQIIGTMREWWAARPIIVLSGRGAESAKVAALEAGADDYVTKPFGMPELLARVRAALRRVAHRADANGADPSPMMAHGISVDLLRREVQKDGSAVPLTPNEFRVLATLAKGAGLLVTNDKLVNELWGPTAPANSRSYLRSYISALRQKLERDPLRPALLQTEAGVGYRLIVEWHPHQNEAVNYSNGHPPSSFPN
jgi:two-component system KDP operon response regulator KdpE